ncbi:DUF7118 family protein [Halovivax gelatinilyticus]|uniref:DUF7118 family protein n=1 Tax=Halovivax gelatinilyticus TaxID=2961597 RepID=UPI0020CA7911|nr:hypothetical protein [Halovivax gelatinilyticus]
MATGDAAPDPLTRLDSATRERERVDERIDDLGGEDDVERGADAYRQASKLLDHYDDRATGTGRENFAAYVQLEGQFATLVENLPDDLVHRDAFEDAWEAIDKRRLSEDDFERARAALEPAATYVEILDDREAAETELREARKAATRRIDEIEDELDRLERLRDLATVDLDAPVERIRDPISSYNEAVTAAFDDYLSSASAREVFDFLDRTRWYPLVDFTLPPDDLRQFVASSPDGESTIPELLEYAEYSRSKLAHVVDDADRLKRRVATQQTYLKRLDGEPLTLPWPPAPAAELRFQTRERRPLVERVADADLVSRLREIRSLADDPEYDRLQTAATARAELTADERARVADGSLEADVEALTDERERLESAL